MGLGYSNLGSLIMTSGLAYDSDAARGLCGSITALLHGAANLTSTELAAAVGPFDGYAENREPFLRVMQMHRDAVEQINDAGPAVPARRPPAKSWDDVLQQGRRRGFRNAQATVLAPTGTISFMMDCDTTGIEPDIALVKYKQLAGGGMLKIVNRTVPLALQTLGYDDGADRRDLRVHRRERHDRRRPRPERRASAGLRLCLQAGQRRAQHPLAGPRDDDGRRPAVPVRSDLQDGQHAHRHDARGYRRSLPLGLETGPEGLGHLSRRLQAEPAAVDVDRRRKERRARTGRASRAANGCPTRASR